MTTPNRTTLWAKDLPNYTLVGPDGQRYRIVQHRPDGLLVISEAEINQAQEELDSLKLPSIHEDSEGKPLGVVKP
jgi:hypothetical protein